MSGAADASSGSGSTFQSLNLTSYIASVAPDVRSELYSSPWTCQAVFRALEPLSQQYVMRLLYTAEAVADGGRGAGSGHGARAPIARACAGTAPAGRALAGCTWHPLRAASVRQWTEACGPVGSDLLTRIAPHASHSRVAGYVRNWAKGDTTAAKKHEAALRQLRELSVLAGEGRG
jgi:hypothetical protein